MITEFTIENFRLFDHLHLPKLSRVNLIVGKNSVGKSAVLEALRLYFSKVNYRAVIDILKHRQEFQLHDPKDIEYETHPLRYFYPGQQMPQSENFYIKFESDISEIRSILSNSDDTKPIFFLADNDDIKSHKSGAIELDHKVFEDNNEISSLPLAVLRGNERFARGVALSSLSIPAIHHITLDGMDDAKSAELWDQIALTDLEHEVITGLKLIVPDVTGLALLNLKRDERVPVVKLSSNTQRVPLKSLGDGMSRVFQIILSLVCSKDGVLLIDEFETGLHWSVQPQAWDMIFTLAERLNVQVFCTTHSKDCVESFEQVWSANPEQGSFYRIYRNKDEQIKVQDYDNELLSDSVDTDTEVR